MPKVKHRHFMLEVRLSRAPRRLAVDRKLRALVREVGLKHLTHKAARRAAKELSSFGALVSFVSVYRLERVERGLYRRGVEWAYEHATGKWRGRVKGAPLTFRVK